MMVLQAADPRYCGDDAWLCSSQRARILLSARLRAWKMWTGWRGRFFSSLAHHFVVFSSWQIGWRRRGALLCFLSLPRALSALPHTHTQNDHTKYAPSSKPCKPNHTEQFREYILSYRPALRIFQRYKSTKITIVLPPLSEFSKIRGGVGNGIITRSKIYCIRKIREMILNLFCQHIFD